MYHNWRAQSCGLIVTPISYEWGRWCFALQRYPVLIGSKRRKFTPYHEEIFNLPETYAVENIMGEEDTYMMQYTQPSNRLRIELAKAVQNKGVMIR